MQKSSFQKLPLCKNWRNSAPAGKLGASQSVINGNNSIFIDLDCPLKPGISCLATLDLACGSRCIDCPRIPQYELLAVWKVPPISLTRTDALSGRSRGSIPRSVNEQETNTFAKPLRVRACVCATNDRNNSPMSRDKSGKEELASVWFSKWFIVCKTNRFLVLCPPFAPHARLCASMWLSGGSVA